MEVQTEPMVVDDELRGDIVREDHQGRTDVEEKYLNAFLVQMMKHAPGTVIGPVREGATVVHSPGYMQEEPDGEVEGIEPETLASEVDRQIPQTDSGGRMKKEDGTDTGPEEALAEEDILEEGNAANVTLIIDGDVEKSISLTPCLSIADAKAYISSKQRVDPANIRLTRGGKNMRKMNDLGRGDRGDIKVDFAKDVSSSESICEGKRDTPKVKVIDVTFQREDGSWENLQVAVINCGGRKQYLGGYRNKRTGDVYYHVLTQTNPKQSSVKMFTREVQTYLTTEDTGINTVKSVPTQTATPGIWMPNYADRIVKPRPYVPYDAEQKTMCPTAAAVIIQKAWRKRTLKKFFENHGVEVVRTIEEKTQFEFLTKLDFQKQQIHLMITESHPTNRGDFSNLFGTINHWAAEEGKRLLALKTDVNRKVALMNILRDEVKMLYDLETLKIRSKTENLLKQDVMFLEVTAQSRVREYPKGNVTLVDDVNIQKAAMFKEMFSSYKRTDTTRTERLDMLNCFRTCLNENFGPEIPILELIEILDREADMIIIGVADEHLVYLRKRFETLFMSVLRDPAINPQAKYFRKSVVPKKNYAFYRCIGCKKMLHPYGMFYHLRIPKFSLCKSCVQIRQNSLASLNLAPYTRILERLRAAELKKNCRSAISFLLQPFGTYFIVHIIWGGKCIISESDYLPGLRLTRWLPNEEWSMWNTILLTEPEAAIHERIPDPLQHYDEGFVIKVRIRNILGRLHFDAVHGIDKRFNKNQTHVGHLPSDHLLYVNKNQQHYIPKQKQPEFFTPCNLKKAS